MKTLLLIAGGERVFMDACPAAFSFRFQEHSVRRLSAGYGPLSSAPPPPSIPRQSTDIRPLSTRRSRSRYASLGSIVAHERGRASTNGGERCRISTNNHERDYRRKWTYIYIYIYIGWLWRWFEEENATRFRVKDLPSFYFEDEKLQNVVYFYRKWNEIEIYLLDHEFPRKVRLEDSCIRIILTFPVRTTK